MAGVEAVIHTATLHKPHIATHSRQDFVDTNITGTLNLLEEAVAQEVKAFVFTSTTSVFGRALQPAPDAPAAWITEDVTPVPRNIYGVTKAAAEDLCQAVFLRVLFGLMLFGSLVLIPPFLQNQGGYTLLDSGMLMAPRVRHLS